MNGRYDMVEHVVRGLAIVVLLAACTASRGLAKCDSSSLPARCSAEWLDANLRLNDLQAIGTHNSYKQPISPAEFALLKAANPRAASTLDYSHPPLREQLEAGARQIEIDVFDDPAGGALCLAPRASVGGNARCDARTFR